MKSPADRKFRCEHCERRFFTRKDVRRHLVVHTGKRDFLCQFCPQRFGRKDHLVRYQRITSFIFIFLSISCLLFLITLTLPYYLPVLSFGPVLSLSLCVKFFHSLSLSLCSILLCHLHFLHIFHFGSECNSDSFYVCLYLPHFVFVLVPRFFTFLSLTLSFTLYLTFPLCHFLSLGNSSSHSLFLLLSLALPFTLMHLFHSSSHCLSFFFSHFSFYS